MGETRLTKNLFSLAQPESFGLMERSETRLPETAGGIATADDTSTTADWLNAALGEGREDDDDDGGGSPMEEASFRNGDVESRESSQGEVAESRLARNASFADRPCECKDESAIASAQE